MRYPPSDRRIDLMEARTGSAPDEGIDEEALRTLSVEKASERLQAPSTGLTTEEAERRLKKYGRNELPEEHRNLVLQFLSYFWGPIPWMIEIAALLSVFVRHWADFAIVMTLLVLNALVAFWEEYHAGNAVEALKSTLALKARVRRDGEWKQVAAAELVPGDLIRLRLGDIVPADVKLAGEDAVEVDQSMLTGESLPVRRNAGEALYSGSVIREGESDALVYATGSHTYFGHTTHLVEKAQNTSHFQRAVLRIGNYLIIIALALVIIILTVSLIRGDSLITTLQFALILTVAAIPVAMPAVLSVTMAVGARKLTRQRAIVTRLASIEELAGVDMLCSDKTGTLTKNRLKAFEPYCVKPYTAAEVTLSAGLASRAEDNDAIDSAVIDSLPDNPDISKYRVARFIPFDPVHKRSQADVTGPDGVRFKVTKGAPHIVLQMCDNAAEVGDDVGSAVEDFASRGFRSLGVARTDASGSWRFIGVIPLYDPPRDDTRQTIENAERLGVQIKMVTGDQVEIAKEIARQVGLGTEIQDARGFSDSSEHVSTESARRIEQAQGFAQVFPEHKYRIVEALQQRGHIVGMTGDGVNDAPALKKADAGIAVSGATDAARAAADIALLNPGLSVIVDAIRLSRKIFRRMTSYAVYRIAETIRVLLFMTLSILALNFYPVTAVMIVLLAILNDGPILSIAYDRAASASRPVAWNMREVLGVATLLGVTGVVATFGLFYLADQVYHVSRDVLQTIIFLKLAVAGHLTIFVTRTRGPFWSSRPSAALFWTALSTKLLATAMAVFGIFMVPISWKWALAVWGYSLLWFFVNDWVKEGAYYVLGAPPGSRPLQVIQSGQKLI